MGKFIKAFFQGRLRIVDGYWVIWDLHHMARVNGKLVYHSYGWLTFTLYHKGRVIAAETYNGYSNAGEAPVKRSWRLARIKFRETIRKYKAWKKIHPGRK